MVSSPRQMDWGRSEAKYSHAQATIPRLALSARVNEEHTFPPPPHSRLMLKLHVKMKINMLLLTVTKKQKWHKAYR